MSTTQPNPMDNPQTRRAVHSVLIYLADGKWHIEDEVASRHTSLKMAALGLLERCPPTRRGRKTVVRITEKGEAIVNRWRAEP